MNEEVEMFRLEDRGGDAIPNCVKTAMLVAQKAFNDHGFLAPVFILKAPNEVFIVGAEMADDESKDVVIQNIISLIRKEKVTELIFVCEAWVTMTDGNFKPTSELESKAVITYESVHVKESSIWFADTVKTNRPWNWEGGKNKIPKSLSGLGRSGLGRMSNLIALAYLDQN